MTGIEFVDEDSEGVASDDELAPQPRRPLPRWAVGAALTVLAAGFVVAVGSKGGGGPPHPSPVATRAVPGPSPTRAGTVASDPFGLGEDLDLSPSTETVLAVAAVGPDTWVLRSGLISVLTPKVVLTSAVPPWSEDIVNAQLMVDARRDLAWAVFESSATARVVVYRGSTLAPIRTISYRGAAKGAAALDGRLYLTVDDRIVSMTTAGQVSVIARPQQLAELGQLVADPARDRLLALSAPSVGKQHTIVWPVSPRGEVSAAVLTQSGQATVAVSATGQIWLAGRDDGGGVLVRLDPDTLASRTHSVYDPILEPSGTLVAAGVAVVWLRDATGTALRCIDARTGDELQSWLVKGPVASGRGHAVIGFGTRAGTLALDRCVG